jgi:hypothetical protein
MHSYCLKCKEYAVLEDGYCQVCGTDYQKILGEAK